MAHSAKIGPPGLALVTAAFLVACVAIPALVGERRCLAAEQFTPEQFGAAGNGTRDDTDAFCAAAEAILAKGGGVFTLTKGKTYRVGRQERGSDAWPFSYYRPVAMFRIFNAGKEKKPDVSVTIEGNNATVKLNDGLRIGAFDHETGTAIDPKMPFTDNKCKATVGSIFSITGCASVEIRNLQIDGNVSRMVVGGGWGDTGRQCEANGIMLSDCERIRVDNVVSSHCGLDGIGLADWQRTARSFDWEVSNSRFEYNARQGMSWCGGRNLTARRCKFNHTGRDTFASAPGAGLDIESESSPIRNGTFVECEFVNNVGCGMVADSGDSADVVFDRCLFWGTTSWSTWPRKPGFRFNDCTFHGQVVNVYGSPDPDRATQFRKCRFEDVHARSYEGSSYSSYALPNDGALIGGVKENVLLENCTFIANKVKSGGFGPEAGEPVVIRGCDFTHTFAGPMFRNIQCVLYNVDISDTRFHEALGDAGDAEFSIALRGTVSIGPGVVVDGPACRWGGRGTSGIVGAIPSAATVTASPMILLPGSGEITAKVRYAPGSPGDWVGLFSAGDDDAKRSEWQHLNALRTPPAAGVASATLTFPAPKAAGKYELRLFAGDGGRRVATSPPIVVTAVALRAEPERVEAGKPITVRVSDAPPADGKYSSGKNWVGLYRAEAADNRFRRDGRVDWQYLNGLQQAPSEAMAEATLTFTAPADAGEYDLRFFLWNHDGRCLVKSARVTVEKP
jgi:hypothetical protein